MSKTCTFCDGTGQKQWKPGITSNLKEGKDDARLTEAISRDGTVLRCSCGCNKFWKKRADSPRKFYAPIIFYKCRDCNTEWLHFELLHINGKRGG